MRAVLVVILLAGGPAVAQPKQEVFALRPIPPKGVAVAPSGRASLTAALGALGREIESLRARPAAAAHLPDVEVFHRAVAVALRDDGFYAEGDVAKAQALLEEGRT